MRQDILYDAKHSSLTVLVRSHLQSLSPFAGTFVINLEADRLRLQQTADRLTMLGIAFERFPALSFAHRGNFSSSGMRGCNASHLAVVRTAAERNLESVLILEDDVIFRSDFQVLWAIVARQLVALEYDIFYGYQWRSKAGLRMPLGIVPIGQSLCTHFWAIHSRFYHSFIRIAEENQDRPKAFAIDQLFSCSNARLYAPSYNLAGQNAGRSRTMKGAPRPMRWHAF